MSGTSYAPGPPASVVTDEGQTFVNILATSGTTKPASDPTHWQLVAAKGATGATGPTGGTGAAGAVGPTGATGAGAAAKFRVHNFAIKGTIAAETYPCAFLDITTGQTSKVVKVIYKLKTGGTVKFKLQKNGVDMTGFTGLEATTSKQHKTPEAGVSIASEDEIDVVVESVTGTPGNLSVGIVEET